MSPRQHKINLMRIAGYHNDSPEFTRVFIGSRISNQVALDAYEAGQKQKQSGLGCTCSKCHKKTDSLPFMGDV
jgi:hypothetical protein